MNGGFPSRYTYLWFREAQDVGNYTLNSAKDYSRIAAQVYNETIDNEGEFFEEIGQMRSYIQYITLEVCIFIICDIINSICMYQKGNRF